MRRDIAGIVLAGGQSRRMGGGDKSLLPLGSGSVLDQILSRFGPQIEILALSANGDPERFSRFGLPVLADTVEGFAGPLAGILTGLEWAIAGTPCKAVVTAAGDTPFLPLDLVDRLAAAARDHPGSIAVASSAGRRHPTFALWPTECRDALRHFLVDEDNRRVSDFIERHGHVEVEFRFVQSAGLDPFFNINVPDDLAQAARLLQSMTS
ncbi:molybdenum cofactor guanylyltransferase MobA [Mesorhizobium japonicum]|uniref:Molybdenum cofactor guanylyltransferase n=1 Tax=Mesorhizobium japonicum (strain LMG 29417 / CECT 9101 / MAFF 303099) TaxID=266835 RepID=MOBA_RHILO|nr:molybdenum cofactor guanylyltransferase MobA [Mesorhizobium japonicum]Q98MK2.1 RecName: Full=Molybdenum cofactor guanylyltransferase; Short=MoCo guanylyltransferase; AltName: Full=GTP:molybdopterin guanylyltransferase; AltName: Full=Mo-MPT guanylyltransferase; AltName: Full=Molybdopterin guanylyltransferase; AltName: Full=Molybdopterin-guanine dinucleotide synthase; Short=MGD synthase [Mesorhizobium japonicum MAFF 303099]BAB48111.1 molybdopterin-guanine dinucleotide biosynthesis protein A [Mes